MRRRKALVLAAMLCCSGCGSYAQMQADLAAQGREGIRRVEAARQANADAVRDQLVERRRRLAAAFEGDVHERGTRLTAEWVVDAGRAYAVGLERLAETRAAQAQADAIAADNAAAADEALALLERMLRSQSRIGAQIGAKEVRP